VGLFFCIVILRICITLVTTGPAIIGLVATFNPLAVPMF